MCILRVPSNVMDRPDKLSSFCCHTFYSIFITAYVSCYTQTHVNLKQYWKGTYNVMLWWIWIFPSVFVIIKP